MQHEKTQTSATRGTLPARIGRFLVVRELGRGTTGSVYLARDPVIDREVAIKTFSPIHSAESRKSRRQQFINEARAAGRLSHPCIVTIFEAFNEGETTYIAMEHLEGTELSKMLARGVRFPPKDVALIVKRLAQALEYAHKHDVVHRDIKPSNIFMLARQQPKIVDFGIARAPNRLAADGWAGGTPYTMFRNNVMGTPNYMSPEQALGRPADLRTDIYSLGVVMYEMLTGRRPFDSVDTNDLLHQVATRTPRAPHAIDVNVPQALSNIAMRAMARQPNKRYQRADELLVDLKRYLAQQGRRAPTERPSPKRSSAPRLRKLHLSCRNTVFPGLVVMAFAAVLLM
jgi:serine/threonine protein kinase